MEFKKTQCLHKTFQMNQLMVAIIDNVKQLRKALVPNADIAYLTAVICIVCNTNNQTAQPLFSIIRYIQYADSICLCHIKISGELRVNT
jgi:hypothetical protein